MSNRAKWDRRWLDRARQIASWSKDPSTKVGCVLVRDGHAVAEGYNGFPHGLDDAGIETMAREDKYERTVHAEANAVAHAARFGHTTVGCTAYVLWPPCARCATLLIQAGVREVVIPHGLIIPERWRATFDTGLALLDEAGVILSAAETAWTFQSEEP